MGGRGAVPIALALFAGLLLGGHAAGAWAALSLAGLAAATLALVALPRTGTVLAILAVLLCAAARGAAHAAWFDAGVAAIPDGDALVRFEGEVRGPPAVAAGQAIAAIRIERSEPALVDGACLRLRFPEGPSPAWSDRVSGLARLQRPGPPTNPGGFDARRFAMTTGVLATGSAVWWTRVPAHGLAAWPRVTFGRLRTAIERRLRLRLTPAAREVVVPLVLGDRTDLSPILGARFRVAGVIHLIALSGLHVAWLAEILRTIVVALRGGRRLRALAGALCGLAYVGIAGPIPSLSRVTTTEVFRGVAALRSRRLDAVQALALSAIVLLLARPEWIHDLGFGLSCGATLGLVTIGRLAPMRAGILGTVMEGAAASLGAQLASLPLLLTSFHLVPWAGPIANVFAIPIVGLLLPGAWMAIVLDLALPGAATPWFHACEPLSAAFRVVTERAAHLPSAACAVRDDPALVAVATAAAALLMIAGARRAPPAAWTPRPREGPARALVVGAALAASTVLLCMTSPELRPPRGRWWLVALDVGQGDALALGFPDGWWVVDTGVRTQHFDAGEGVVLPFLRWAGVRELRGLALTHDDSDHVGGAPAVLDGIGVAQIVAAVPRPESPGVAARFRARTIAAGDDLHALPSLVTLWPPRTGPSPPRPPGITPDNASGLVFAVGEGSGRALLLADVDSTIEARLPLPDERIAVLKAAHHGAATSSGASFLARARPRFAILSCGRRNRFGHPDPGAVARLAGAGATIVRTDRLGAIGFELDDAGARLLDLRAPTCLERLEARPCEMHARSERPAR